MAGKKTGKKTGKRAPRRGGKRRAPGKRRGGMVTTKGDIARVHQVISYSPSQAPVPNVIQKMYNFSLSNCDRAIQVAKAYQFYRIKYIKLTFKPTIDTYTTAGGASVPYLYYYIDKTGTMLNNNINFNSLRDAGCKPIRFDDKAISIAFKPVVVQPGFNFDANLAPWATDTKKSPWIFCNSNSLSTNTLWNPNSTEHLGMVFGVEQDIVPSGGATKYDVDIEYCFEFKKPTYQSSTGTVANKVVDLNDIAQPPEGGIFGSQIQDS